MEALWLKRLGHHICHIALRGYLAKGDLLLLGTSVPLQSGRPDQFAWCPWSGWDCGEWRGLLRCV